MCRKLNCPIKHSEQNKPALRLPEGLFAAPNPNDGAPGALLPKPALPANPRTNSSKDRKHKLRCTSPIAFNHNVLSEVYHPIFYQRGSKA